MTLLLPAPDIGRYLNRVTCGDALATMQGLPTDSIDLIFIDPPYNLGYRYQNHNDTMPQDEYLAWCQSWLTECIRILRPTGSLFLLHIPRTAMLLGAWLDERLTFQHWIGWKASGNRSNKPLMPDHYALLWYTKSDVFTVNEVRSKHKRCRKCGELVADYGGKKHKIHPYGPKIGDIWTDIGRAKHGQRGLHPCVLPEKFLNRVIRLASNPGDVVLDPFAGTGTTGYVAARLKRDYVLIENSPLYAEIARNRLAEPYTLAMFA